MRCERINLFQEGEYSYPHAFGFQPNLRTYFHEDDTLRPCILIVPGGGYTHCAEGEGEIVAKTFYESGWHTAVLTYTVNLMYMEPLKTEPLREIVRAVKILRANAKTYGYDPERFAVWGESAGGYLATMAAVTADDEFNSLPYIGEEESSEKVSASVKVLMNFYGAVELGSMEEEFEQMGIPSLIRTLSAGWVNVHLKGTGYSDVEEYWLRKNFADMTAEERQQCEPFWYMEKNLSRDTDLHALIWYGGSDITVPCTSGEHMAYLMKGLAGSDKVWYENFPTYLHAADSYYSDENLGRIKDWLDEVFKR